MSGARRSRLSTRPVLVLVLAIRVLLTTLPRLLILPLLFFATTALFLLPFLFGVLYLVSFLVHLVSPVRDLTVEQL
jgi:hypothetical protein